MNHHADHIQREAIQGLATSGKNLTDAAITAIGILFNNKKLRISIVEAKEPKELLNAAKQAVAAGANKKELMDAIKENPMAQKSKSPHNFADALTSSATLSRNADIAPQQAMQKKRTQSISK